MNPAQTELLKRGMPERPDYGNFDESQVFAIERDYRNKLESFAHAPQEQK